MVYTLLISIESCYLNVEKKLGVNVPSLNNNVRVTINQNQNYN